jgi:hypothetical protein
MHSVEFWSIDASFCHQLDYSAIVACWNPIACKYSGQLHVVNMYKSSSLTPRWLNFTRISID